MRSLLATLSLAATLFAGGAWTVPASIAPPADTAAVYTAGSQYTATLTQTGSHWRLQPVAGQDVAISTGTCSTGAMVAPGLWLLVRDHQGGLELVAPSATTLPAGHSGRVALRACDQAHGRDLAVPQTVLDLLADGTGAILVED